MDWKNAADLRGLVHRLRVLPGENEWVEFKVDNAKPDEIGEYISCLSNSAALTGQETGFLIWGVQNEGHAVVGTQFRPELAKIGGEDLAPWLLRMLNPHVDFAFYSVDVAGNTVVVLRVDAASKHPVKFKNNEYIRIGSYKKLLSQHPDHQRRLWKVLEAYSFEEDTAAGDLGVEQVVQLLDYPAFFLLQGAAAGESFLHHRGPRRSRADTPQRGGPVADHERRSAVVRARPKRLPQVGA